MSFQSIFNHIPRHLHQREGGNQGSCLRLMLCLYAAEVVLFGVVGRDALECGSAFGMYLAFYFFYWSHLGVGSHCAKDRD